MTPFELFHGKVPVISHLMEYRTQAHILRHTRDKVPKFDTKTVEAFIVGYSDRINTYRCYIEQKNEVFITPDVVITFETARKKRGT